MSYLDLNTIQRVLRNPHPLLHFFPNLRLVGVILVIRHEEKLMDCMGEIMWVTIIAKVRHQIVVRMGTCLERTPWSNVDVSDDLVNSNTSGHVTPLICLVLKLL